MRTTPMLIEQAELALSLVQSVIEHGSYPVSSFPRIVENAITVLDIYLNDVLQEHARDNLKKTKIGY